jgi:hypothetical protein
MGTTGPSISRRRERSRARVIPVLRQSSRPRVLPRFVGSRIYVDLSEDANDEQYERLLRALHDAPKYRRPERGPNPFTQPAVGRTAPETRVENVPELRRRLRTTLATGAVNLASRRPQFPHLAGTTPEQRHDELLSVIATYAEYLQTLMRASQQRALTVSLAAEEIEHIITPQGWSLSGPKRVVEFPYSVGWAAHRLMGAALLAQGMAAEAVALVNEKVAVSVGNRCPLLNIGRLMGWPVYGGYSNEAWESSRAFPTYFPWLTEAFGDRGEYWGAMVAHAISVSYAEFIWRVQNGPNFDIIRRDREHAPRVPLYFWVEDADVQRRAFRLVIRDAARLGAGLAILARIPNLRERWSQWIAYQQSWVSIESGGAATGIAPHVDLIDSILSART